MIPINLIVTTVVLIISVLFGGSHGFRRAENCTQDTVPNSNQETSRWKVYSQTNRHFSYRVEYLSDWSVEEKENVSFFMPPGAKSNKESIAIVVLNYKKTPPLPVHHTYTLIRTVAVGSEEILVRKREPSAVTEKYFATREKGDYVAEFRFFLDRQYDAVFDHMLSSFTFTFTN